VEYLTSLFSVALIASAIRVAMPILLTALGAVYAERGGVVNIGLEGIMIIGTFFGAVGNYAVAERFPDLVRVVPDLAPASGVLAAVAAGMLFSLLHAVVTITFRVDQIISGVALNLLAAGGARFLNILLFTQATQSPGVRGFTAIDIPILNKITALHPLVTGVSPMIVVGILLVVISQWVLQRTRFGLRLRAVGEYPLAADTLGVSVSRMRYTGVLLSGALGGMAGAYLAIEQAHLYFEGMTQGRGFIALAAMIFGNWWPAGALGASALFGYFDALSLRVVRLPVPYQFISVLPHLVTILVLAGFVRRAQMPAADGVPYTKEEE
jgi:general nucleoside transport system permease protein